MNIIKHFFCMYYVFVFTNAVFAASCGTGYSEAAHNIEWDYNIDTSSPEAITPTVGALNVGTFIFSDDGTCPSGFESYSHSSEDIYPLVEDVNLCPDGYYRLNNNCVVYPQSTCPTNYYSYSLNTNTIAQETNDECPTNYESYTTMNNCDVDNGVNNTCADIATVINLTWDDGTGTISTTCTYNNTITLPAEPTREGYTFTGWKLVPNNE